MAIQKTQIRKDQIWEDTKLGKRCLIIGKAGSKGWSIFWITANGSGKAARHMSDWMIWKRMRLIEEKSAK